METRQLRAHAAAGRSWRVLHAVVEPLSDYLRYEAEWGYTHNAAAGQDIRIAALTDEVARLGDLLIVDSRHVFRYQYDAGGRFVTAEHIDDPREIGAFLARSGPLWEAAEPFAAWWAAHRSPTANYQQWIISHVGVFGDAGEDVPTAPVPGSTTSSAAGHPGLGRHLRRQRGAVPALRRERHQHRFEVTAESQRAGLPRRFESVRRLATALRAHRPEFRRGGPHGLCARRARPGSPPGSRARWCRSDLPARHRVQPHRGRRPPR